MSRLAELERELQDTAAAIVHAERTLAQHPKTPSAAATLRTIQKRRETLEEQFFAEANDLGLDVCGYRIELTNGPATISAMTNVLGTFQKIFTTVYDAVCYGPKMTSKTSARTLAETSFGFAYSFPGSIGIMMTLPNERLLTEETNLDMAIQKTFELIEAHDEGKVQELTDAVGLPAVRLTHQWAAENSKAGFGANITWQRDTTVKNKVHVQPQELTQLAFLISGATAKEEVVKVGELLDVDLLERKFQMRVGKDIIRGDFDTAIGQSHPALLPKTYKATMNLLQKVVISEGQEELTYFLLRLDEPDTSLPLLPPSELR
jgi:hypothetical protein